MHSLETIQRLNAQHVATKVAELQAQGKYVVTESHGLHIVETHVLDDLDAACKRIEEIDARGQPGVTTKLHEPTVPVTEIRERDSAAA